MKAAILFICCIIQQSYSCMAQVSDYADILNGTKPLSDLNSLKTKNDFKQDNLTSVQIDQKIDSLIRNSSQIDNFFYEIPFNTKELNYIGKKHPKDVLTFNTSANNNAFNSRLSHINKDIEIYNYGGIYIFIPQKDNKNVLNLFFTLRALTIIKHKYPEAYFNLLLQQQSAQAESFVTQDPYRKAPSFNKSNSIISFDDSPIYIAASITDLVYSSTTGITIDGYGYYENTDNLVTSIDNENILGSTEFGSKKLYNFKNPNDNYFYYMRDGLIETLIHEFTHNYITNNTTINRKAFFINEMRFDKTDTSFQRDVEEAIVYNTCLRYYKRKGGISSTVQSFYEAKLKEKKRLLTSFYSNKICLQRYYALKSLSDPEAQNFEDIYYLAILEK
ncbi:MAG: hypothetical protein QM764_22125 [Chitinophagaceae bacterium]